MVSLNNWMEWNDLKSVFYSGQPPITVPPIRAWLRPSYGEIYQFHSTSSKFKLNKLFRAPFFRLGNRVQVKCHHNERHEIHHPDLCWPLTPDPNLCVSPTTQFTQCRVGRCGSGVRTYLRRTLSLGTKNSPDFMCMASTNVIYILI